MGEVDDGLSIYIHTILNLGMEVNISIVAAEELDDSEEGQWRMFVHGSAGLVGVKFTCGWCDHFGEGGFDVYDVADDAALDQGNYVIERRTEGGLAGFEEDEVVALREVVELAGFGAREDERDLAENMLAGLEGTLRIFVVSGVRGCDVYRINAFYEVVERGIGPQAEFAGKGFGSGRIGVQDRDDLGTADDLRLGDEPPRNTAGADNSDAECLLGLLAELSAGDAFRTRKVDNLAILIQVIELPYPVRSDGEDIDIVFLDIINLLAGVVLNDNLVGKTRCLDSFDPLQDVVTDIEFATSLVKAIGSHTDDQVIAKFLRPPQQVDMSLMQQVVCSVSDDFYHRRCFILSPLCSPRGFFALSSTDSPLLCFLCSFWAFSSTDSPFLCFSSSFLLFLSTNLLLLCLRCSFRPFSSTGRPI